MGSLLLLASLAASGAVAAEQRPRDVAAIRAHVEKIFTAYQRKDRDEVRRTHVKDWRGFLTESRGVLRGIDEYMREAENSLGSPARIERWSFRDFDTVFYGDVAIVSYVADLDIALGAQPLKDTLRVIDVYRRGDSGWEQVASQVARHPDAVAQRLHALRELSPVEREKLLTDREAVWRAYFAGNADALGQMLPAELIGIDAGETSWSGRREALDGAAAMRTAGAKLLRLEFPRTEIQVYGDTAILYSEYVYETETAGRRDAHAGRCTEIFVRREGRWVNAGWHLDSGK